MKILLCGDTHGNLTWTENVVYHAAVNECDLIFQLGDFGFVWNGIDKDLDELSNHCKNLQMPFYFLPGNHENHVALKKYYDSLTKNKDGHVQIKPCIFYVGRISQWNWEDTSFTSIGGAVSIDRDWRQKHYRNTGEQIWWSNETLTEEEWQDAFNLPETDILLAHDTVLQNPFKWLKQDIDSEINRRELTKIVRSLRPRKMFTGHYHTKAEYDFYIGKQCCKITTLNCDGMSISQSTEIIEI